MLRVWLAVAHLLPAASLEDFCVPAPAAQLQQPSHSAIGGPAVLHAALRPHLRRCLHLHLPAPQDTAILELCLLKSARIIDKDNFSVFLGYFSRWGEGGGAAAQEYTGGNAWGCKDARRRSITLSIACSSGARTPAITQWRDDGECHYEAHLLLPGAC